VHPFASGRRPIQPPARTSRAHRSLALMTKHPVVVRRASRVYEPLRTSYEVLTTVYEVLGASDEVLSALDFVPSSSNAARSTPQRGT